MLGGGAGRYSRTQGAAAGVDRLGVDRVIDLVNGAGRLVSLQVLENQFLLDDWLNFRLVIEGLNDFGHAMNEAGAIGDDDRVGRSFDRDVTVAEQRRKIGAETGSV